ALAGRVTFLGFRADVPALMSAVDIVVRASVHAEPFGRVVVEGMLANRPVVASAAGGVLEIVDDRVNGLLAPPGDARALPRCIGELVRDPAFAARLAATGHNKAIEEFSCRKMLADIRAVILRVLAARAAASHVRNAQLGTVRSS